MTVAAVLKDFGFIEAVFNISFADVENDGGFDFMATTCCNGHNLVFFTLPTTDRREDEGILKEVATFEIR